LAADALSDATHHYPQQVLIPKFRFYAYRAVVLASLIGIVAAFAVPRFTGLRNGVRASEVTALGANFAMQRRPRTLNFWPRVPLS
jgi:hypothetical protein